MYGRAVLLTVLASALAAAPAAALTRSATLVSSGDVADAEYNGGAASFRATSPDFRRIVFFSTQHFAGPDPDGGSDDVFVREGGRNVLVSVGTQPWEGDDVDDDAEFHAASPDARRVLWSSEEDVTADDTDPDRGDGRDIFLTEGGMTRLISTGPPSDGDHGVSFGGASRDLSRVVFSTSEPLVPEDADGGGIDVYLRAGDTTTLLSNGPGGENAWVDFAHVSADGRRVYFTSEARLAATDTDDERDGFEWRDGVVRQVTLGPAGGNGPIDAGTGSTFLPDAIASISVDGSRAWFYTQERLTADDRDERMDLYERSGGKTRLVSTGPAGGSGEFDVGEPFDDRDPAGYGALAKHTPDGKRVFFYTRERLTKDDRDERSDLYVRSGGRTRLLTAAGRGKTSETGIALHAISTDGRRAVLWTRERLTRDDKDDSVDVYSWTDGGGVRRLSTGPRGGNDDKPYFFVGLFARRPTDAYPDSATRDARVVFFNTFERLTSDDRSKGENSTYESRSGAVSLARVRTKTDRVLEMGAEIEQESLTPDGRHLILSTPASYTPGDDDGDGDVYLLRLR
jgi:hypothetical protein